MKIKNFLKKEIVLVIAFVLALASMFFVPPSRTYIQYFDFRTLAILFSLMFVMAGLRSLGVFDKIGELMISKVSSIRGVMIILVMLCFFFSMLITNDVALLTFVPFTIIIFGMIGKSDKLIITVVLETIAANLGSMMTPTGNPQNLYLYDISNMEMGEFALLMLPYGLLSLVLIVVLCIVFSREKGGATQRLQIDFRSVNPMPDDESSTYSKTTYKIRLASYLFLFALILLVVIGIVEYHIALIVVIALGAITDYKMFLKVDYAMLLTFACLFVFIGNLGRLAGINELLMAIIKGREVAVSVATSQVISNVSTAILLAEFSHDIRDLLIGTNIGGLGTVIASMASLISFKLYSRSEGADKKKYFLYFTATNVLLLAVLLAFYFMFGKALMPASIN